MTDQEDDVLDSAPAMGNSGHLAKKHQLADTIYVSDDRIATSPDEIDWEDGEVVGVYELVRVKRVTVKTTLEDVDGN